MFARNGANPGPRGWSNPEPWGVWSNDDESFIKLHLEQIPRSGIDLAVQGHAFLARQHRRLAVDVAINGHPAGTLRFDAKHNEGVRVLHIPSAFAGPDGLVRIRFGIDTPVSPQQLGVSADNRSLGLGLEALTPQRARGRNAPALGWMLQPGPAGARFALAKRTAN